MKYIISCVLMHWCFVAQGMEMTPSKDDASPGILDKSVIQTYWPRIPRPVKNMIALYCFVNAVKAKYDEQLLYYLCNNTLYKKSLTFKQDEEIWKYGGSEQGKLFKCRKDGNRFLFLRSMPIALKKPTRLRSEIAILNTDKTLEFIDGPLYSKWRVANMVLSHDKRLLITDETERRTSKTAENGKPYSIKEVHTIVIRKREDFKRIDSIECSNQKFQEMLFLENMGLLALLLDDEKTVRFTCVNKKGLSMEAKLQQFDLFKLYYMNQEFYFPSK